MSENEFLSQLINLEPSLEKFAYRLTSKKDYAKDLVQETFLKVLLNRDKYVNNKNFKAWTFTIMKNTFINDYRRTYRSYPGQEQVSESIIIKQSGSSGYDNPDSAYSVLELTQIIKRLNDKFRIPFEMHINGYKYKEIANKLDVNVGTVKSRIFITRRQLKHHLSN